MFALSQKIALPQTVALAEAQAALRAVIFAQELCFFWVQIEGDCMVVIRALVSQARCNTLYGMWLRRLEDLWVLYSHVNFCMFERKGIS